MTITLKDTVISPANNQLAAYLFFNCDTAVTCSYTVLKRSTSLTSVDFSYSSIELIIPVNNVIQIPVIGLYANFDNNVTVILKDQAGDEVYNSTLSVSTEGQTYIDATIFHLNIEQTDPEKFATVWGNSWLMTTYCNGYDQNGDLRCYYTSPYRNQMLKTHNGNFYIGSDEDEHWYGRRFFKIDILGNVIFEFDLRDSDGNLYCNTHDLTWDSAGYLYMVGNDNPDRSTNTLRQDAWILKFNDQTGKMIWAKNYTTEFDNTSILNNSPTNDVHINSLACIQTNNSEYIVAHSRSASVIFGASTDDGHMVWSINSGNYNAEFPSASTVNKLTTTGVTTFENGAHTVFPTQNNAFAEYTDVTTGKFVLSLFDNCSCSDDLGNPVYRPMSADASTDAFTTKPVQVLFYAVDLSASTVKQVGGFSLPSTRVNQITDFMGAVFEYNDYYSVYTNLARSFFISDVNGGIVATIYDVICSLDGYPEFPGECYRARLFTGDELSALVSRAFLTTSA